MRGKKNKKNTRKQQNQRNCKRMRTASRVGSTSSNKVPVPTTPPPLCVHAAARAFSPFPLFLFPSLPLHSSFSPLLGLVPLVHNHEQAPGTTWPSPAWSQLGQELGPTQQERHINWVSLMCKLMFGEHREKITQIILTAAEENVCVAPLRGKLGGRRFFFSFFRSFVLSFFLSFFLFFSVCPCLRIRRKSAYLGVSRA